MEFDVIVVGAGAVGGSIAYELSARGLNVCRVGETDRTNAASMAAGAMNGCFGEITSGPRKLAWLKPSHPVRPLRGGVDDKCW